MPWASAEDLRRDSKFRDLAVQSISQTGYTYLFDAKTCIVLFHSDKRSEGENLLYVFRGSPDFLSILEASLRGPNVARGYYQVGAGNSHLVKRFVCMVPLNNRTADGTRFIVTAVVNAEGLSAAVKNAEEIHRTTKNYLAVASEQAIRSFRHSALLFMGTGIIIVSLLAFGLGLYFSRAVRLLREAMARINKGDYSLPIPVTGSGEVSTLIKDFNKMIDQLGTTTVSKQLLQASERRLKVVNSDLRKEITEREWTEEALSAEKERLSVTLRSIGDGVVTADAEDRVVLINHAAEKLTGWESEEAAGIDLSYVFHTLAEGPYPPLTDNVADNQALTRPFGEKVLKARDGTKRVIVETRSPISDKDGQFLGTVIVFRDISEQKRMNEELLRMWRDLSFSTAHKIGNPIFAIETDLNPLLKRIREGREDESVEIVANIRAAVEKAKAFIEQFKSLAKAQEITPVSTRLRPILEDACKVASGQGVECCIECPDDLAVIADPDRLAECFDELVMNATRWLDKEPKRIRVSVAGSASESLPSTLDGSKEYLVVHVADNGTGIELSEKNRIFDAFYTKCEHGTGLGLALVRRIIDGHGGSIIESGLHGKGADFEICLPLIARTTFREEASFQSTNSSKAKE